jgi:hypothetical protein
MGPDGRPHTVCASHGGLTPNPRTAVLSDIGRQRISAAAKAHWERYRANKLAGLPIPQVGRPKRPMSKYKPAREFFSEKAERRRARIIADLKVRFPDRNWDDLEAPD